jgi:N-acylneuraminate cytidylyltransferase
MSGALSPDIEWLRHALETLRSQGREYDGFAILRPTSPFRKAETIRRAVEQFASASHADSLRAVEKCKQHPGKMWVLRSKQMLPLFTVGQPEVPWHSTPYQALPEVYVQNASLEVARSRVVFESGSIAGEIVIPFLTERDEGFDVNNPEDWIIAEHHLASGQASLPVVQQLPWHGAGVHSR